MTVAALIADLESRSILLSLDGDQIRYRSPRQALTDSDRDALRARRGEILDYLGARNAARALRAATPIAGVPAPSVAQEMWRAFAGGADEGKPVALNIGMVGRFKAAPEAVTAAVRQVIARYEALRTRFEAREGGLLAFLNPADAFEIEQEDLRGLGADAAREAAGKEAQQFCARLNLMEGTWLTRAKVVALPDGESLAAISAAHMIADAGTRNIILEEIHDILETGAPRAPSPVLYNDYSLAERNVLASGQGAQLIEHWRRWYHGQSTMLAPDGTPLTWGNGIRLVKNFTIPRPVADKVRDLAGVLKVTSFLVYLTIFSVAMARWAKMERFPVRVLGDKRVSLELTNTVGLMFCADAVEVQAPAAADFETIMRGILAEYDTALSLRIPTLHFWAPHCVRPGIEAPDYPNKIPAVFNYYSLGTAREKAERRAAPDTSASPSWPPDIMTLSQTWPRRSSPLFLHVMDYGHEVQVSLHFFQGVVSPPDQDSFTAMLFRVFAEVVPA
ncbi:MAG TPA: condensation domain-containing protein [Rhizomicrobium sp.]|jgi:pyochelin synthetase|nr:condensation domain-containing protein [Rhizomicrobium sp.]